jgi:hypothetical protein
LGRLATFWAGLVYGQLLGKAVLQVIITDRLAKEKYSVVTQWIDFEVVK